MAGQIGFSHLPQGGQLVGLIQADLGHGKDRLGTRVTANEGFGVAHRARLLIGGRGGGIVQRVILDGIAAELIGELRAQNRL